MLVDRADVDVNARTKYGDTPLQYAIQCERPLEYVKYLIAHRDVDINSRNKNGISVFATAISKCPGRPEYVRALLESSKPLAVTEADVDAVKEAVPTLHDEVAAARAKYLRHLQRTSSIDAPVDASSDPKSTSRDLEAANEKIKQLEERLRTSHTHADDEAATTEAAKNAADLEALKAQVKEQAEAHAANLKEMKESQATDMKEMKEMMIRMQQALLTQQQHALAAQAVDIATMRTKTAEVDAKHAAEVEHAVLKEMMTRLTATVEDAIGFRATVADVLVQ